jgi:hypothetical protein
VPEPYFRPPKINVSELTALSRIAEQQTDRLRRSGALQIVDTQAALRSIMPGTSRMFENYFNSSSVLDVCLTQRHGPAANQSTSWDPGGCW